MDSEFEITYADGTTEKIGFAQIDVPMVNRKNPVAIAFGGVKASLPDCSFTFGDLVVPFAFPGEETALVFFTRKRKTVNQSQEWSNPEVHCITFGLRNTVDTPEGLKNFVQLVWVYPDGRVAVGGNK